MEKSLSKLIFLAVFLLLTKTSYAETASSADLGKVAENFDEPRSASSAPAGSFNETGLTMRVGELSSRITELERDFRFQSDRIRQLERTVDDLRRNH